MVRENGRYMRNATEWYNGFVLIEQDQFYGRSPAVPESMAVLSLFSLDMRELAMLAQSLTSPP